MQIQLSIIYLVSILAPSFVFSQSETGSEIRSQFEIQIAELNKPLEVLNTKYRDYLTKQRAAYETSGNAEAVAAVEFELENFSRNSAAQVSPFPELKRLQQIYWEQRDSHLEKTSAQRLSIIIGSALAAEKSAESLLRGGKEAEARSAWEEAAKFGKMVDEMKVPGEEMETSTGVKLCWIPSGEFMIGSPDSEEGRHPRNEKQARVTLTMGFWLSKFEVTQEFFETLTGDGTKNAAAEKIAWNEAMDFCRKLTDLERKAGALPEGWEYSLPTEAQWEFACRAGEEGPFSGGTLDEVGWYDGNSGGKVQEVGQTKPNAWGLHDMHGNVTEWCLDFFAYPYPGGFNPSGPEMSKFGRVFRGGSWSVPADACRSANRSNNQPDSGFPGQGFRVALIPSK